MSDKTGTYFKVYWPDDEPEYEGVHGHVGFDVFCAVMKQQGFYTPSVVEQLEHVYFRYMPTHDQTLDGIYIECPEGPGPGAFPVTVWRFPPLRKKEVR